MRALDPNKNFSCVAEFEEGFDDKFLELSNGYLASSPQLHSEFSAVTIWDTFSNFTKFKKILHMDLLLQLKNGDLLTQEYDSDYIKVLDVYTTINITSKITDHQKEINKLYKANNSLVLSLSEDKLCLNQIKIETSLPSSKCRNLENKIQDILPVNNTHFITSYFNGNISYWDNENLKSYYTKHISEILNIKKSVNLTLQLYASKFHKTPSGEIVALFNNNMSI